MKYIIISIATLMLTSCYRELYVEKSTETINLTQHTTEVEYQPMTYYKSRWEVTLVRKRNRYGDTMFVAENLEVKKDSNIITKDYERITNKKGKMKRFDYPIDLLDFMEVRNWHLKDTTHNARGVKYHFEKEYPYKVYYNY
jgi:hypothetical protein